MPNEFRCPYCREPIQPLSGGRWTHQIREARSLEEQQRAILKDEICQYAEALKEINRAIGRERKFVYKMEEEGWKSFLPADQTYVESGPDLLRIRTVLINESRKKEAALAEVEAKLSRGMVTPI